MATRDVDVLLIGGGLASAACAAQLREEGFDGSVLLVGREADPPYDRPPVSKEYLRGEMGREDTFVQPLSWYDDNDVELALRTSVLRLDPGARVATLSTREDVHYERALLATGANVRRLPVDGSDLEGIHYLRALRNADVLRDDVADAEHVVLVGGSYIGTEVAASLTKMGKQCTIVMQEDVTLAPQFGERAGRWVQSILTDHGVTVHGRQQLARFTGAGERVQCVACESGLELEADAVVLGVGAVPENMLARAAGLELGPRGGAACDQTLRTSAPGLWCAGDMCYYDSVVHGRSLRVEHWDVAVSQGRAAARSMLGATEPYDVVPYFFSDLADWASMEYVGPAASWEVEITRGSLDEAEFSVWYVAEGRVVGALSVGRSDDLEHARRLMRDKVDVSERLEALYDLEVDLAELR